jgi:hypothetical protein
VTEAELKARVVRMAHDLGWLVFSLPMVRNKRPVNGASGYPDLTLVRQRKVLWLELKQDGEAPSAEQERWLSELPAGYVVRPRDLEDLPRLLA